jgi:hypothetical protein
MGLLRPRPADILDGLARHGLRLLDGRIPHDDDALRALIVRLDSIVERKAREKADWDAAHEARLRTEGRHRIASAPDPVPAPRPVQPPRPKPARKPLWTRPTSKT